MVRLYLSLVPFDCYISCANIYLGNFGQANYSAAKMGLVGFTKTLALEGSKYNIKAVVIAPVRCSNLIPSREPKDFPSWLHRP